MNDASECVGIGVLISFLVSALKKIPGFENHPKLVATLLSAAIAGVRAWAGAAPTETWGLAICVLTQLAAAIGTFEVVTKPVGNALRDQR